MAIELLDKPRVPRVLRHLARAGALNQRAFTEISRHSPEQAKQLRDALEEAGVIEVRDLSGHGKVGVKQIVLTPVGQELADLYLRIEQVATKRLRLPRTVRGR